MSKFGSAFAWITYLFIVIVSIVYFFMNSHFDTIYTVTEIHPLPALEPYLDDVYDLIDENVKAEQLQGDPNQNLLFQLALSQNVGIPDPKLVKPKCV